MVRRELVLELQLARIALFRGETQGFRSSLGAAAALLERDFDVQAGSVAGAVQLLSEMQRLDVGPDRPDISGSLNLLRSVSGGVD